MRKHLYSVFPCEFFSTVPQKLLYELKCITTKKSFSQTNSCLVQRAPEKFPTKVSFREQISWARQSKYLTNEMLLKVCPATFTTRIATKELFF